MTRVLVIQMCRMGDVLQTTPMLRGLRRTYPEARIDLLVHDQFGAVPIPSSLYDRAVVFPATRLGTLLACAPDRWPEAARAVREVVDDVTGRVPCDLTVNLTHSDLSALIAAAVPSRRVEGVLIAPDRTKVLRGRWLSYLWASQHARSQSSLNLVDVYTWAAGVEGDRSPVSIAIDTESEDAALRWLEAEGLRERPFIAVQLGSSEDRRRWPAEEFARALDRLPTSLGDIVFVGTAAERPLLERARRVLQRAAHDAMGRTSLAALGALLRSARLLVTNDTGSMHVAAAVGTHVLALATGPAFVHETGPYGAGHLWLEPTMSCFPCTAGASCHHFACRTSYGPEDVAACILFALGAGPTPPLAAARLLRSRFGSQGEVVFEPAGGLEDDARELLRAAMRDMWLDSLKGVCPATREGPALVDADPQAAAALVDALGRLAHDADRAAGCATRVAGASGRALSTTAAELERRLVRIWTEGASEPACQAITAYLKTALDSLVGLDLARLAARHASECSDTAGRARILARLVGGSSASRASSGAVPAMSRAS